MRTPESTNSPPCCARSPAGSVKGCPCLCTPGDVAWFQRLGADATAAALRVWESGGSPAAIGLLDGPTLLRLGLDPDAADDDALAGVMARDIQGLAEVTDVEAGLARLVRSRLAEAGWADGEPFTPLVRDLAEPVDTGGFDIRIIGPDQAHERAAVQRAAFPGSTFTVERWHAMAAGPGYADGRCVVVYDGDTPAAAATVWSAGPGRPGLLEPVGTHPDHRGRGLGRAVVLGGSAVLRDFGASSATVATPASNTVAVAAYESAGFRAVGELRDVTRPAAGAA